MMDESGVRSAFRSKRGSHRSRGGTCRKVPRRFPEVAASARAVSYSERDWRHHVGPSAGRKEPPTFPGCQKVAGPFCSRCLRNYPPARRVRVHCRGFQEEDGTEGFFFWTSSTTLAVSAFVWSSGGVNSFSNQNVSRSPPVSGGQSFFWGWDAAAAAASS